MERLDAKGRWYSWCRGKEKEMAGLPNWMCWIEWMGMGYLGWGHFLVLMELGGREASQP